MAFDGIVVANLVKELQESISGGRIQKIAQPEPDELLFAIKGPKGTARLLLSASASLPLVYLTEQNKPSPMKAPNFCMLLRKHIGSGRILSVTQPGLERVIRFQIEHLNDLGDVSQKILIVEIMGKHSNIVFCDDKEMILDSIKHISGHVSSIREVLPGRSYFIPKTLEKESPLVANQELFLEKACSKPMSMSKAIYSTYTGISPLMASEICFRASLDGDMPMGSLSEEGKLHLYNQFSYLMEEVKEGKFSPNIVKRGKEPIAFASVELNQYRVDDQASVSPQLKLPICESTYSIHYDSISKLLQDFYAEKEQYTRMRQKSVDLRKIVSTALERNRKKYDLQLRQMKDTEKKDKYKVYGELLHTYGYGLEEGQKELFALNYHTNETIQIPLDPQLNAMENAKKYFERYNKLKRTQEALSGLIQETKQEILHLESIATALDIARAEDDLLQIKEELIQAGYIRKRQNEKKIKIKSKPFHYLSSDGFPIYVGKNNLQNEELIQFATGNDWWFHAKGIPGSHVIVKSEGKELPDRTFEEAGKLAAYYSKARGSDKVEIDYLERKNIKKPSGSKPGFVVYYTNYSLTIDSDISGIELIAST